MYEPYKAIEDNNKKLILELMPGGRIHYRSIMRLYYIPLGFVALIILGFAKELGQIIFLIWMLIGYRLYKAGFIDYVEVNDKGVTTHKERLLGSPVKRYYAVEKIKFVSHKGISNSRSAIYLVLKDKWFEFTILELTFLDADKTKCQQITKRIAKILGVPAGSDLNLLE